MSIFKVFVLLAVVALSWAPTANAQISVSASEPTNATPVLPDPLTPEAANALISRLSDSEVRVLLLDQLNTQAIEVDEANAPGLSDFFITPQLVLRVL